MICLKADSDVRHVAWYKQLLYQLAQRSLAVTFVAFGQKDYDYAKAIDPKNNVVLADTENIADIFSSIGQEDVVLAERYHGMILSLIFRKRFVPLIYDYKHLYLLDDIDFAYKRHLLNYDIQGHLAKLYETDVTEVADDLVGARMREYSQYFYKVEELCQSELQIYVRFINGLMKIDNKP